MTDRPRFDPRWADPVSREHYRATFDEDPEAYHRSRPVCPPVMFDDLVSLAGLGPGATVVEIGPGTGQATRPLAERGLDVLALELGPGLAATASRNLADLPNVRVLNVAFEDWDDGGQVFDAVFACNSFHWIDPDLRFVKAANLLRPGGCLIVLAASWVVPDDAEAFWWEVQDDYAAVGRRIDPATQHPDRVLDLGPLVRASGLFGEPVIRRYPFSVVFSKEDYLTNLSTQSGIKEFPESDRQELMERIGSRIDAQGGQVRTHLLGLLTVAQVL